jgi:N-methylhydantoinase B
LIGAPGLNASSTDLYGEGLILPPMRCNYETDWREGNLRLWIGANIRVPEQTLGDIDSQFAACFTGAARVQELCARYGAATVEAAMAGQIAYVERCLRAAIGAMPDGEYVGEDYVDDDGLGSGPLLVRARVTITGDALSVDFSGTAPQVRSHMNAPYASVVSGTLAALKSFLTGDDVPFNEGASQAVTITVPEGTLLNPRFPAPVATPACPVAEWAATTSLVWIPHPFFLGPQRHVTRLARTVEQLVESYRGHRPAGGFP